MGEVSALRDRKIRPGRAFFAWFEPEYMYKRCLCKTKKNHDIITYAHANTCVIAKSNVHEIHERYEKMPIGVGLDRYFGAGEDFIDAMYWRELFYICN